MCVARRTQEAEVNGQYDDACATLKREYCERLLEYKAGVEAQVARGLEAAAKRLALLQTQQRAAAGTVAGGA